MSILAEYFWMGFTAGAAATAYSIAEFKRTFAMIDKDYKTIGGMRAIGPLSYITKCMIEMDKPYEQTLTRKRDSFFKRA